VLVSTGVMSNISPQKNARTPEQNIALRNLCKTFWLEETAILDMQMSKLPMISGYDEIGWENDQTYIFRFVKYLSTFFYTYLPVNIHFQLIIITDVSILTYPTYFVPPSCHCGILALRPRDF
jgi:hypothetical protein